MGRVAALCQSIREDMRARGAISAQQIDALLTRLGPADKKAWDTMLASVEPPLVPREVSKLPDWQRVVRAANAMNRPVRLQAGTPQEA